MARTIDAAEILGLSLRASQGIIQEIRAGLPTKSLSLIETRLGATKAELAAVLFIPERTLQRRRTSHARLRSDESDRLYRLAKVVAHAIVAIGDEERAMRWLREPNRALGGVTPLSLLDTEAGTEAVEGSLGAIQYGGVA